MLGPLSNYTASLLALFQKALNFFRRLQSLVPTKLPQGMTDFENWAKSIITAYEMPDNDSVRFALAAQIMHLPSSASHVSKAYFGRTLVKGAASQVAHSVMHNLKEKQKAEQEAAKAAEATTAQESVASSGQKS